MPTRTVLVALGLLLPGVALAQGLGGAARQAAERALATLEESARRQGVPPGWLR